MLVSVGKFKGICNFPPLPEFEEEEEERALVASYYTFENELDRIREFASIEFDILVVCSSEEKLKKARNQLGCVTVKYCHLEDITILERSLVPFSPRAPRNRLQMRAHCPDGLRSFPVFPPIAPG